ncbi:MAG: hypothetical protein AAFR61_21625 [Bacteroidota bacterium]
MKRKQVPQFTNQAWFPQHLKTLIYEFMSWFVGKIGAARPFLPVVEKGLLHTPNQTLINIEVDAGAGMETLEPHLPAQVQIKEVALSDFHTTEAGLYTMVNAFHQLPANEAQALLTDVAQSRNPVMILEGNNDSLWQVVGMTIFVPLTVLLTAPLVTPFRWTRLLFTYLIPILPIITLIDGFLALFKLYAPGDLDELTSRVPVSNYAWESGKMDNGRGGKIMYLLGHATA